MKDAAEMLNHGPTEDEQVADTDDDAEETNDENNGEREIQSASGSIDTNGYLTNRELGEE